MTHEHSLPLLVSYVATMSLGLAARYRGRSFGTWHHVMFALTCVTFIFSVLLDPVWLHVLPACVLALLPVTRPRRSRKHDAVAVAGLLLIVLLVIAG
ncbi:MAG: hypothetical protein FGM33_10355 [Candidatus Kapabacteria bacterium]|nr:hypothetical protein [Candidatus Kapabacteria bacterium]